MNELYYKQIVKRAQKFVLRENYHYIFEIKRGKL